MKFKVRTKDVASAIIRLSSIPQQKAHIMAYSYIRLLNKDNKLKVQALSGAIFGEVSIDSEGEDADIVISGRIVKLISAIQSDEMEIDVDEASNIVNLYSGTGSYTFTNEIGAREVFEDYIKKLPEIDAVATFTTAAGPLIYAMRAATIVNADVVDNTVLCNVRFCVNADELIVDSTDKFVILRGNIQGSILGGECTFLLSSIAARAIIKAVANNSDIELNVIGGGSMVRVVSGNVMLYVVTTQERYVNIDRVIDRLTTANHHKVKIALSDIKSAAMRFGNERFFDLQVKGAQGKAVITRDTATTEIAAESDADIDICINISVLEKLTKIAPKLDALYLKDSASAIYAKYGDLSLYASPVQKQ